MQRKLERVIPIIQHMEEEEQCALLHRLSVFIKEVPPEKEASVWKKTLIVTDCMEGAELAHRANLPCLGLELKEPLPDGRLPCRYLVTDVRGISEDYLERVYRRFYGLPWEILESRRCLLRETVEEDAGEVLRLYEEAEEFSLQPPFYDEQEGKAYIHEYREKIYELYEYGLWTLEEKESGQIIGIAGLENQIIEGEEYLALGYIIDRKRRRQGYGEEICRAILEYGRKELGITKLHCFIEPTNEGSWRLAEKLGFCRELPSGERLQHYVWQVI